MDVASICSPIDDTCASFPKLDANSSINSAESPKNKNILPPITSLLNPIPEKIPSTHHENPGLLSQNYLQNKPNSVLQKGSANNSPSLLNLRSLSLETTSTRPQSTQTHPSPPPTTPSLSRSNSNILLNEQNKSPSIRPSPNALTPKSRPSPPVSVASLSKQSPSLNPHELGVSQQQSPNSSTHSSTPPQTYQQSQWQRQHLSSTEGKFSQHPQISPSSQQNVVVAVPPKDAKQDSALQQQQQQTMQYNAAVAASGLPSEYHYYRASFEKDVYQSVNRGTERTMIDLKKIIDHCALIGQFAAQYGEIFSRVSSHRPDIWPMQPTAPIGLPTEAHVSEMINKAFDVLYVLNDLKDEASRRGPTEIDLIRNKRSSAGNSPTRPKYRKRTKRPAPPGRCHSCNIQETPEWRRGPDGARTLCNACGLHFAKLTRKRAQNAIQEQQQRLAQQRTFLHYPPPYLQMASQNQNALKIAHYPGFPQHNVGQGGNQFTTTTTSPISMVTQVGYSARID